MSNFLGYFYGSLEDYYSIFGNNGNPEEGTENYIKGFNSTKRTKRYTRPIVHPDSTCDCDDYNMPIAQIMGSEKNIIALIDSNCSQETLGKLGVLKTLEEVKALGWFQEEVTN